MSGVEITQIICGVLVLLAFMVLVILDKLTGTTEISIKEELPALIAAAAKLDIPGPEKMKQVVSLVIADLPKLMKRLFSEKWIQKTAQHFYDEMKRFAQEELKKAEENSKDRNE